MTSQSTSLSPITTVITSIIAAMAFISPAFAADIGGSSGFASLIPLILIMVIFYFLLIRPQQKKLKEHRNLVNEIKKGDNILTSGGMYGKIIDVKDDILKIEIATGVRVHVRRDTITGLADTAPPKEKPTKGKAGKNKPRKNTATEEKGSESTPAEDTNTQDKA